MANEEKTAVYGAGATTADTSERTAVYGGGGAPVGGGERTVFMGADSASMVDEVEIEGNRGPKMIAGWLVVISPEGRGSDYWLTFGRNSIGRSPNNHVVIENGDTMISRENHAEIIYDYDNNIFLLRHGQGQYLTYLNGRPVYDLKELHANDIVKIGETSMIFVPLCNEVFRWNPDDFASGAFHYAETQGAPAAAPSEATHIVGTAQGGDARTRIVAEDATKIARPGGDERTRVVPPSAEERTRVAGGDERTRVVTTGRDEATRIVANDDERTRVLGSDAAPAASEQGALLTLVDAEGRRYPVRSLPATIGKSADNTVAIPNPYVSRRHAELLLQEGRLVVRDLGSSNGTLVDGVRITAETPVADGTKLGLSSEYTLTVSMP
jgi:pSer/pThr/pTyr-binding forkhead associated (FHA) protein